MNYVQACLNSIGFPRDLEQLEAMWLKHRETDDDYELDIEILLDYEKSDTSWWYAPKWIQPGDLMFFYQTSAGLRNAKRLLKQCREEVQNPALSHDEKETAEFFHELLIYAVEILEAYESTIFAIAEIDSIDNLLGRLDGAHFAGGFFAPIKRVKLLDTPILLEDFREIIMVSQSTITPLFGDRFTRLKQRVDDFNELPDWILDTAPSNNGFRDIDQHNWRELALSDDCGFVMEEQVRAFFLDYLLKELSGSTGSYYEECNCFDHQDKPLGRSDYFIKLGGAWFPVEAKIDIRNTDVQEQVNKYLKSSSFVTTRGKETKSVHHLGAAAPFCIIADRNGFYLADETGFAAGSPGAPWISRKEICNLSIQEVKDRFENFIFRESG